MFWQKLWLFVRGGAKFSLMAGEGRSRQSRADSESAEPETAWCVAANVVMEREYGPGGAEKRSGTKHFPAGSKVYLLSHFWGMGGERVTVVGRHRGSHRYVAMTISSKLLANRRAELVYSPHIVNLLKTRGEYCKYSEGKPGGNAAKLRAEEIVAMWKLGGKEQPFLTRDSSSKPEQTTS